ncbi:MAG: protein kinase [Phycisphaeraceae bacterium]|nr:protein kinase [Phycisphaeraceae bacterium]
MNEHDNKPNRDRVRSIFDEVADLAPTERAAALGRLCVTGDRPDAALREEVEGLLASHDAAQQGRFMTSPTAATTVRNAAIAETPGMRVGPYKLLQVIGEGGFGTVFLAEQTEPVRRRVALKIIKLGMDTKQVIARFEAERQALALMDHPHIARVLDAGATPVTERGGGRPYFVMEYVVGDVITQFADANGLDIRARLALFAQVCSAVQHAHTKGIIHRDIKPGNVLVTMTDGKPFARVIDFGIAKATGGSGGLTDKTLFTEHRQLIGTPEYMSPEQAQGSPDIDTRTDVYALGVLLYELLAGETPFDGKRLRSAAWDEMRRIIKEEEPPTPSVRVTQRLKSSGSASSPSVPPAPVGGCPSVPSDLRGELDWIVMKSLDKDRGRRYETPSALAADVERHLRGEAVVAAPPSAGYRLRKFVRRNKGPVIAGSAVAAALLVGIAGTTWQWNVATRANNKLMGQRDRVDAGVGKMMGLLTDGITRGPIVSHDEHGNRQGEDDPLAYALDWGIMLAEQLKKDRDSLIRQTDAAEWSAYIANIFAALSDPYSARRYLDACAEHLRNWEWRYLRARADTSQIVLKAPGGENAHWMSVASVAAGDVIVARAANGQILCFNAASGEEIGSTPEDIEVYLVNSSPHADMLAVSGWRIDPTTGAKTLFHEAWDSRTLKPKFALPGEGIVSPRGERVFAAGKVMEFSDGSTIATIDARPRYEFYTTVFAGNGTDIVTWGPTADDSYRLDLWDGRTGECLRSIERLHTIFGMYAAGGVVVTTHHGEYRLWHGTTLEHLGTFEVSKWSFGASVSPDGRYIFAQQTRQMAQVVEAATGRILREIVDEVHGIHGGVFSPDGERIVFSSGPFINIVDTVAGNRSATLAGHDSEWIVAEFCQDGSTILSRGWDGTARIWNANVHPVTSFEAPDDPVFRNGGFETNRDSLFNGTHVLAPSWDGEATIALLDADTGSTTASWIVPSPKAWDGPAGFARAFFSPDGKRIIAQRGSSVRAWDASTGSLLGEVDVPIHIDNPDLGVIGTVRDRAVFLRFGGFPVREPVSFRCDDAGSGCLPASETASSVCTTWTLVKIIFEASDKGLRVARSTLTALLLPSHGLTTRFAFTTWNRGDCRAR